MTTFSSELSGSLLFASGSTTSARLIPSASDLQISASGDVHLSGSRLLWKGSNIVQRIENIEAGSGDAASLGPLNATTGALNTFTGSADSRLDALEARTASINSHTQSIDFKVDTLISKTGSYLTTSSTYFSSSAQISSSGFLTSESAAAEGFGSGGDTIPAGTLSSSAQVEELGFITGSPTGTISSSTQVVASLPSGTVSGSDQITGSLPSGTVSGSDQIEELGFITGSPDGTISSSAQVVASLPSGTISGSAQLPSGIISGSGQLPSGTVSGSAQVTGSTLITASVSSNTITFTKGDQSTFDITVDTGSGGGGGDIGTLNSFSASVATFTGSIQTQVDTLESKTGSYATTASNHFTQSQFFTGSLIPHADGTNNGIYDLGTQQNPWRDLFITTASIKFVKDGEIVSTVSGEREAIRVGNVLITTASLSIINNDGSVANTVFSSSVDGNGSASLAQQAEVTFDGNKQVSNTELGDLFSASFNPGTTGSISEFLNAVFFPNSTPTITTGNQTINEFTVSGSSITTVAGTDPEGQTLTFGTSSAYTDDFVRVASNGAMTLNTLATGSMNTTDRGDGTNAHPIILTATDTFNATATKTIYLTVEENTAPVFRETSVSGNIITSFTTARNENASTGLVTTIFFSDAEGDAITIQSQSEDNHFLLTRTGSYVRLLQNTASLDYESKTSYTLALTASDEHKEAGLDDDAVTTLPITINVTDNVAPTFNNQTVAGISESAASGTSAGSATASDPEGDTLTFTSFTLQALQQGGGAVSTGSYGGTGKTDPTEDPFTMDSSGNITLDAGAYLNSELIDTYIYSASVKDPYNTANSATVTIPIADDLAPTISGQTALYIIESAVNGNGVKTNTNGYSGNNARFTANQSVTWTISSSNDFSIDTNGYVTIARNISGSSDVGGDQLVGSVTASNTYGTTAQTSFTVNITDNVAPTITFTDTSANLNTNGARSGSTVTVISFSDTEGDTIDHTSFVFTDPSGQLNAVRAGNTYQIQAEEGLSGSDYQITASIADTGSFETRTSGHDFTIAQAGIGTLSTNGTFRIIESAESGDEIKINANGRTGTQADLSVSYSPQYNSAAVQSFTSSNAAITVNSSGNLSLGVNISGSATASGDTITSDITFRDQYDNIGSGSITVNVVANNAPSATFTDQTANLTASVDSGSHLVTVAITDDENDTPFSMSLSGTDASKLTPMPQNSNSSSYYLQNNTSLSEGDLSYTASIHDNFGKSQSFNEDLTIAAQPYLVYAYGYAGGTPASEAAAFGTLGDAGGDGTGITSGSVIAMFESGALGTTFTPSYVGGACTLIASASLDRLNNDNTNDTGSGLASLGYLNFSSTAQIALFLFPSASVVAAKPGNMYTGTLPDSSPTAGEYALYAKDIAIPGVVSAAEYYFDLEEEHLGYSNWGMILQTGQNNNNSRYYLVPSSGSNP